MAFGPNSLNPRENRSYAHALIAHAVSSGTSADKLEALKAANLASGTRKGADLGRSAVATFMRQAKVAMYPESTGIRGGLPKSLVHFSDSEMAAVEVEVGKVPAIGKRVNAVEFPADLDGYRLAVSRSRIQLRAAGVSVEGLIVDIDSHARMLHERGLAVVHTTLVNNTGNFLSAAHVIASNTVSV